MIHQVDLRAVLQAVAVVLVNLKMKVQMTVVKNHLRHTKKRKGIYMNIVFDMIFILSSK